MDETAIEKIFNAAPVALLVLDPELRMVAATDEYLASTKTTREALIGRHVLDAFPPNDADPDQVLVKSLATVLRTGRSDSVPVQGYDIPDAGEGEAFESRSWSVINTPVVDDGGGVIFVIHRADDVTGIVTEAADASVRTADGNPQEWSELTRMAVLRRSRELQAANTMLKAADVAKNTFLSRMSHELRTPLNAVIGFSQLLQLGELSEDDRSSVDHILKAGRHLLALINDVLDLSGIESGQMSLSLEPVEVADAIVEVIDLLQPMAMTRSVTLSITAQHDEIVRADRQRLKQVLLNLGSNAIKYNRDGGSVRFLVGADGDFIELGVSDDGPGISPAMQERLFTPFDRLGAEQSTIEGTGLGLALSRTLVEAMEGTIRCDSTPAQGATFWIRLNRALPEVGDELAPEPQHHQAAGTGTLLYVEDNLANIRLMERILAGFPGVELQTALQGGIAVELAKNHRPGLILLDLNLPDLRGDVVLARLKADPATRDIPVVVLSADANQHQIDHLLRAGAESYLTKPFELAELMRLISAHLEVASSQ